MDEDAETTALEEAIDRLYGLPLEDFTAERDALARRMRREGRREAAERVRGLRKPTVAAWAVNQVMRTQPGAARALLEAGERLRQAHAGLAAGQADADELRRAAEAERAAVADLAEAAQGLLTAQGRPLSAETLDRVRETLHAASVDDDARADVTAARVSRERRAVALDGLAPMAATEEGARAPDERPRRRTPTRARAPAKARGARQAARDQRRALRDELKALREQEAALRRRVRAQQRSAAEAEHRLQEARAASQAAQQDLELAQSDLSALESRKAALEERLGNLEDAPS